jgi:hypothetical protein
MTATKDASAKMAFAVSTTNAFLVHANIHFTAKKLKFFE